MSLYKDPNLTELIEKALHIKMTPAQKHAQMISFVYGNLANDNPNITRSDVEHALWELMNLKPKI